MARKDRRLIRIILTLTAITFLLVSCEAYVVAHIHAVVIKQTRMEI